MDYEEYKTAPENLEFERADADQQRVFQMINEKDKIARTFAMVMIAVTGIVATVILYIYLGMIAGIAALAAAAALLLLTSWYLSRIFLGFKDFWVVRVEAVSTCYHARELYSVDLWSQEQQKCVTHRIVRSDNHVAKGVQGYFVKAVSDKGVQYLLVTDREYEIMKKNSKNLHYGLLRKGR